MTEMDALKTKIGLPQFARLGVAVKDVEKTADFYSSVCADQPLRGRRGGLGFENGGGGLTWMEMGLHALEETRGILQGEMAAFGCFTQLVLENYPKADIDAVVAFCSGLDVPAIPEEEEKNMPKELGMNVPEGELFSVPDVDAIRQFFAQKPRRKIKGTHYANKRTVAILFQQSNNLFEFTNQCAAIHGFALGRPRFLYQGL